MFLHSILRVIDGCFAVIDDLLARLLEQRFSGDQGPIPGVDDLRLSIKGRSGRSSFIPDGVAVRLAGVDFDLHPGEILGIIGPNGAGKTTLMECLVGLLAADGGSVSFGGMPVPPERRREAMFYLPDGIAPWSDQPVWRVTGLFRELHGLDAAREVMVVQRLELAPVLGKRVAELSKGYRRRLLLALALLTPQPMSILPLPLFPT